MVARGVAAELEYRRAGGRLNASQGVGEVEPEPGTALAEYGTIRFQAPTAEGEIPGRRGSAWGGVTVDTARGDHGRSDAVDYDGAKVRSRTPVFARGPGYQVESRDFTAQSDGSRIQLGSGVRGQLQVEAQR